MKCLHCGNEIPINKGRHADKKYCSQNCQRRACIYRHSTRKNALVKSMLTDSDRCITVHYPGVVVPDRWTPREYQMYGRDLPADCQVEGV